MHFFSCQESVACKTELDNGTERTSVSGLMTTHSYDISLKSIWFPAFYSKNSSHTCLVNYSLCVMCYSLKMALGRGLKLSAPHVTLLVVIHSESSDDSSLKEREQSTEQFN